MRLARLSGADLRKEPALLLDAVKAQGFFPGPRAVFVDSATDGLSDVFAAAFQDWRPGDAQIIATAGQLNAKSKLRKVFETDRRAYAIGIYDDPPGRDEIEDMVGKAGLSAVAPEVMDALVALSTSLAPHDFRQTIEKLGLFKRGDDTPATVAELESCCPRTFDAELDDLINAVSERRPKDIAPLLARLNSQGTNAVTICLGLSRHFKTLYTISADPGGPGAGIGQVRPPIFGPRRDRVLSQARSWGVHRSEAALSILIETDLQLRSSVQVSGASLIERTALRLSMMSAG